MEGRYCTQATLPDQIGELGRRRAAKIALPVFISAVHSVRDLVEDFLSGVNGLIEAGELQGAIMALELSCPGAIDPEIGLKNKQRA